MAVLWSVNDSWFYFIFSVQSKYLYVASDNWYTAGLAFQYLEYFKLRTVLLTYC